jgi:hypothetical protein
MQELDQGFVTLAMIYRLVEDGTISRDQLAEFLDAQFSGLELDGFSYQKFAELLNATDIREGTRCLALINFILRQTDAGLDAIREVIRQAVEGAGAADMPEFLEAELRMACAKEQK